MGCIGYFSSDLDQINKSKSNLPNLSILLTLKFFGVFQCTIVLFSFLFIFEVYNVFILHTYYAYEQMIKAYFTHRLYAYEQMISIRALTAHSC